MHRDHNDRRLWQRLEGYSFHEKPLSRSLIERLQEETGHSVDVCYTVVEEYRRFMFLNGIAGDVLVPSPIVDMVWRLHANDKNAYERDFCMRIFGRMIPYGAEDVSVNEQASYERTLEAYAREFGRPQVQYWPDPVIGKATVSSAVMWIVGIAAFAAALLTGSFAFVAFGLVVIVGNIFLNWKFTPLPLQKHNSGV